MNRRRPVLLGLLLGGAAALGAEPPSAEQIRLWVQDLDAPRYAVRAAATERLRDAGKLAVAPLAKAAEHGSLETSFRSVEVLRDMTLAADSETAKVALAALTQLATSANREIAARAQFALTHHVSRIAAELLNAGAELSREDGAVVGVSFNNAKPTSAALRRLVHLPHLTDLDLGNRLVDDTVMSQVPALPNLARLNLFQSAIGDASLKQLQKFPKLSSVPMGKTKVTDAGLAHLQNLTNLTYVGLRGDNITDAGLVHLRNLKNLEGLNLAETKVTDAGLVHLEGLKKLDNLYLSNTAVTDAGLERLQKLPSLTRLYVTQTKVTLAGIAKLKTALPRLHVESQPNPN